MTTNHASKLVRNKKLKQTYKLILTFSFKQQIKWNYTEI